jgi:2'-5' RNA ligase
MSATTAATIRAFVALDLDEGSLRRAARVAEHLRRASGAPNAAWAPRDKMHVTVKFAGRLPVDAVAPVSAALAAPVSTFAPPQAVSLRLDAFPAQRNARVVVLCLDDSTGQLAELAASVDRLLVEHGVPAEVRSFRPHVTLARLKRPFDARRWLCVDPAALTEGCALAAVTLYRSDTRPEGALYTPLARFELEGHRRA